MSKRILYMIGITLLSGGTYLSAQTLNQAKELYNEGKYAEAKPVFERFVKQAPGNASYNQWYGVCCFETGDLAKAEKHLKVAVRRRVQEAYRYLGEVYYHTYRFDEAEEMFDEYVTLLAKKKKETEAYDARVELAGQASRMLDKVERVQIIDSVVVDKDALLSAYTLSEECGSLSAYNDFFQTGEPGYSTVYMNQKGDKIYYVRPAEDGHDYLFTQSLLMNDWGDEKQLPMNVNSEADDGYPFVLSDGVTIYYASKGHGSLGGYDLFVTRYNSDSETYLAPEQLGMPFNSPFNDYMMVIDETKHLGWFASDRYQPEGKACVYLFIPNESRERVESDDIELKRSLAAIASIRDTWAPDTDYSQLVALAHEEIPFGPAKIQKDFIFPIHDDVVYYTLADIQSPEAKSYYEKAIAIKRQIQELGERLDGLRVSYTQGNAAKREQLTPAILQAEEQLDALLDQPKDWEKKARNAEIAYLRKNPK